jgi:alpha-tubulin suppressor-like RCC1 family protein
MPTQVKRNLILICLLFVAVLQAVTSGAQTVTKVAGGAEEFSLFLKSDGSLWGMGNQQDGELGNGLENTVPMPTNLPELIVPSGVTTISGGWECSLFIKSDGSLWATGYNANGELGDGNRGEIVVRPKQIVASGVTAISSSQGDPFTLFLMNGGSLWAVGDPEYGALGDGPVLYSYSPVEIVASNVTAIAAGGQHSLFLKNDGSLWAMGSDEFGQLGDGLGILQTNLPEQIVASNVVAIAAGGYHSLFLKSNGSLWAMGLNLEGQLGDGTYGGANGYAKVPEQIVASNVVAIAAGFTFSLFVKSDGSLWAMGAETYGQLGNGTSGNINKPTQIVASGVTVIAAGNYHSLFVKSDGSLWVMGENNLGQLGDGTYNNTNRPEEIVSPPSPPNITNQPTGQSVLLGGSASFTVSVSGTSPFQYQWLFNGTNIFAATNTAYIISPVATTNAGNYSVVVTNSAGSAISSNAVLTVTIPAGYNQISGQIMSSGDMHFSYVGIAGWNYALDRSFSLAPPNWIPQVTNPADMNGNLVFTNTPDPTTNNFWRIRSVP